MTSSGKLSLGCCALAVLLLAGCGGGELELDTVPVTGTVTYDGRPVEGATVTFSPVGDGHAAAGVTDASGKYVLTSVQPDDGAVPGEYKVTIVKMEKEGAPVAADPNDIDAQYAAAEAAGEDVFGTGGGEREEGPKHLLPEEYASISSTPLTATVAEGDEQSIPFELE